ncbi:MAG: hypothetical protein D6696_15340 [Acidobacteria bacterium]|nr:MAG: hypothetical protein D6696_15340 [Acidobacteriota bacterium]
MNAKTNVAQGRRFTDDAPAETSTTVAAGTRIEGTLTGSAPLDVSGTIEGGIDVDALVWVRPDGHVKGEISARSLVVEGHLDARIDVRERIELRANSKVRGDLQATEVAIADGAFYEGRIEMEGAGGGSGSGALRFQEKRRSG